MDAMLCELQCPVCLELLQHPVVFPCSHVLCHSPCAERLFDHGFVRCPVCRENSFVCGGVDSLPRVKSLENIIDYCRRPPAPAVIVTSSDIDEEAACITDDDIACQLWVDHCCVSCLHVAATGETWQVRRCCGDRCDAEPHRKAIKSCVNCSASYCQRCLRLSHPNREPFSSHQLVQPGQYRDTEGGQEQLLCPRHGARVNVYCSDCRTLGCLLCADDSHMHPNHHILSLAEAGSSFKVRVTEQKTAWDLCQQWKHLLYKMYCSRTTIQLTYLYNSRLLCIINVGIVETTRRFATKVKICARKRWSFVEIHSRTASNIFGLL